MTCAELMREFGTPRPDGWIPMLMMRLVDEPEDSDLAMHPELLRAMRALGFTDQQSWEPANFFRAMDLISNNWAFAVRLEGCGSDESITRVIGVRTPDVTADVGVPLGFRRYQPKQDDHAEYSLVEGGLYPTREPLGAQSVGYGYTADGHFLTCILTSLDYEDTRLARRGKLSLGLYSDRDIIMVTYRLNGVMDGDIQYSIHLAPGYHRELPSPDDTRLTAIFVRAESHKIAVIRKGSMNGKFAAAIHEALKVQAELPWDACHYQRRIKALYHRCPRTKDLETICSARCEMGY